MKPSKVLFLFLLLLLALPVVAAQRIDEVRAVAADAVVEVQNVAGSVQVRGSTRGDVRITGRIADDSTRLVVEGDARRLKIRVEHPRGSGLRGWWGGGRQGDADLVIEVPAGVELKIEAVSAAVDVAAVEGRRVQIESVSGAVEFSGAPGELEIESVSGTVRAEAGGSREVSLETVSGSITLTGTVGERLKAESVSGRMRLTPQGDLRLVQLSTVSGSIELETGLARGGRLNAESLSGELAVTLPRATSARLQASSFSGTIRSDVGTVEKEGFGPGSSLRATLGDGDGQIRLESFSGTLRLHLQ